MFLYVRIIKYAVAIVLNSYLSIGAVENLLTQSFIYTLTIFLQYSSLLHIDSISVLQQPKGII